jgi:hypothetical protein
MLGGVVSALDWLLSLINSSPLLFSLPTLVEALVLTGLVGFHTLQKGSYGRIGQAGFYIAALAIVVYILGLVLVSFGSGLGMLLTIGAYLGELVGFVLYGVATLQARVLPRWCGIGFIIIIPLSYITGNFGNVLAGVIWLALGYALWSQREKADLQNTRVS